MTAVANRLDAVPIHPAVVGHPDQALGPDARDVRLLGVGGWTATVCGFVVLLLIVGGAVLLAVRDRGAVALALEHIRARHTVTSFMAALVNAETGQRGYLLSGRSEYLQPYEAATAALPARLTELGEVLAAEPGSASYSAALQAAARRKLAELAHTVELARSGDVAGAVALLRTDSGKRDMDEARSVVDRLDAHFTALVNGEFARVVDSGRLLIGFEVAGLVLLLGLGAAVANAARRGTREISDARARLTVANAQLERVNEVLEEKVARRTAALAEAGEEIQRFAYIVSHDLRAPLVNIMGFTSELETVGQAFGRFVETATPHLPPPVVADIRPTIEEDLPEAIGFIKTSAAKMDRLIGAILQLSRNGRRVLKPEPVDMRALFEGIAASMAIQLAERGARIELGELPDVVGDRLALEQVFSNLIENAVKYAKPGRAGRIVVRGRTAGPDAIFEVEDNGRGIAPRDHERIFELFRRAGDQDTSGEGIGLAHVRALLRRLGGRIDCVSALDVGSTFKVQVPLVLLQSGAK